MRKADNFTWLKCFLYSITCYFCKKNTLLKPTTYIFHIFKEGCPSAKAVFSRGPPTKTLMTKIANKLPQANYNEKHNIKNLFTRINYLYTY